MSLILTKQLQEQFGEKICFQVPLEHKNYLRLKATAKYFLTLTSCQAVTEAIAFLRERELPYFILGRGTNTLIDDIELTSVIIALDNLTPVTIDQETAIMTAPADMPLEHAVRHALKHHLGGLEFAMGIPGSIGGAVKMNAGTPRGELRHKLIDILILRQKASPLTQPASALALTYRHSNILNHEVILSARFQLRPLSAEELAHAKASIISQLKERKRKQPLSEASLGSTFKNPQPLHGQPRYAAQLITEAGLKGKRIGGISISTKHANFIINDGTGTATDAYALLATIEETVYKKFGVSLEREIILLKG